MLRRLHTCDGLSVFRVRPPMDSGASLPSAWLEDGDWTNGLGEGSPAASARSGLVKNHSCVAVAAHRFSRRAST